MNKWIYEVYYSVLKLCHYIMIAEFGTELELLYVKLETICY